MHWEYVMYSLIRINVHLFYGKKKKIKIVIQIRQLKDWSINFLFLYNYRTWFLKQNKYVCYQNMAPCSKLPDILWTTYVCFYLDWKTEIICCVSLEGKFWKNQFPSPVNNWCTFTFFKYCFCKGYQNLTPACYVLLLGPTSSGNTIYRYTYIYICINKIRRCWLLLWQRTVQIVGYGVFVPSGRFECE